MNARFITLCLMAGLALPGIRTAGASPTCAMVDVQFDVTHACPYDTFNLTTSIYNPNFEDVTIGIEVYVTFEDEVLDPIPGEITVPARTGRSTNQFHTMPPRIPEGWMTIRVVTTTNGCVQSDEAVLEVREGDPEAGTESLNLPGLGIDIVQGLQRGFTPNRPSTWGGVKTRYLPPQP